MLLALTYRHVNTYGNNPEEKKATVANIKGYKIHWEENS